MWILLSGEGTTDIGINTQDPGPITLGLSQILEDAEWGLGYSFVELEHYSIVSRAELSTLAEKKFKAICSTGKKNGKETKYFKINARCLAILAKQLQPEQPIVLPILFRDADGTASSDRGEWGDKWKSILDGFQAEGIHWGVPVLPRPIVEAWILCALKNGYRHCAKLETRSGNRKQELTDFLGQEVTPELLNQKVEDGELEFVKINDMPSFTACYERLKAALAILRDKPTEPPSYSDLQSG